MASFSRSFRSQSYLSPRLRPSMPGRNLSNSSDRSIASDGGDEASDRGNISGRTTPIHGMHRFGSPASLHHTNSVPISNNNGGSPTQPRPTTSTSRSRPISIELPRVNRINSAPVYTPPEPLSARGDLPGGYFPLHEDPKDRIHRPHPFRSDRHAACQSAKDLEDSARPGRPNLPHPATTGAMNYSNAQVTSYFPTGYGDNPLPMGKYYPTNYENRQKAQGSGPASVSAPEEVKSPSINSPGVPQADMELHRKLQLQQYQRDMIAQASLAANQVIGASGQSKSPNPRAGNKGLRVPTGRDGRLGLSFHKPSAPKLHPLGSPGPVTPMELSESGGSYLDKGQGSASPFDT